MGCKGMLEFEFKEKFVSIACVASVNAFRFLVGVERQVFLIQQEGVIPRGGTFNSAYIIVFGFVVISYANSHAFFAQSQNKSATNSC